MITLTALWDLVLDSFDCGKVLVIAPKRVAEDTWPKELAKWDHLKGLSYSLVMGTEKQRREALRRKAFLYIINRENVTWLVENYRWDFDTLVIDELSSFKSSKAQRFRALKRVRPLVKRVIGLTGTTAPNTLIDLWPQIYLLDMGKRLGRFITGYRDRFFVPDKRNREIVYSYKLREGAEQSIYELISDLCISMKATDHLKMPELISNRVEVHLSSAERKQYDTLRRDMVLRLQDGQIDAVNAASLSGKLIQMANGAVYDTDGRAIRIHDRKLDALEDLIEAANGKPLLVAYWYKHDLARIRERFDIRVIDTAWDIDDWNAGRIPVALIHPASAGHGLNLQEGGSTVVWFGLTWSLELYQQLNARLGARPTGPVIPSTLSRLAPTNEDVIRALDARNGTGSLIEAVKARIGGGQ